MPHLNHHLIIAALGTVGLCSLMSQGSSSRTSKHSRVSLMALAAAFLANVAWVPCASAAIVNTGNTYMTTNALGETIYRVGQPGTGTVTIDGGSTLTTTQALIGVNAGSNGTATVTGVGSSWTTTYRRILGYEGSIGTMNILNGGTVYDSNTIIAGGPGTVATMTVDGPGSLHHCEYLMVGSQGSGTLNVLNGGTVVGLGNTFIGGNQIWSGRETSVANIDGAGSSWTIGGLLFMGHQSTHDVTLNITNQGIVRVADDIRMAFPSTATATININGGTLDMQGNDIVTGDGLATFNFMGGSLLNIGAFDFDMVQNGGTLAAGNSPGTMEIGGDYYFNAGVLEVELAGNGGVAGADFDFYDITGTATLEGTIDILSFGGFSPSLGDTFDVLTATNIIDGGFTLSGLSGFTYSIIPDGFGNEILRLQAVPEPSSLALAAVGAAGFVALGRRRRKCR